MKKGVITFYTDTAKITTETGLGIFSKALDIQKPRGLENNCSVLQLLPMNSEITFGEIQGSDVLSQSTVLNQDY